MTGDTGPDPWEGICIHVAHMVIEKAPDIIDNGFDQFGVHIKPYKTVDLPDVTNYDTNQPLTGFCGLGYDDEGNASLTLEQLVLTGLDTIQATEGQLPRFTIPDTEMVVPVTIGKQQIAGRWTMRHSCKNRQDGSTSTKAGSGGFTLSLTDTNVLLTISGLDKNTGSASAASLTWAQWETIDWAGFCAQKIPPPLDPSPKLVVTYDPDCPLSVKTTLEVYFGVEANALTQQIACNLNDLITGAIKVDGASSLADEILVAVNAFFNAI